MRYLLSVKDFSACIVWRAVQGLNVRLIEMVARFRAQSECRQCVRCGDGAGCSAMKYQSLRSASYELVRKFVR